MAAAVAARIGVFRVGEDGSLNNVANVSDWQNPDYKLWGYNAVISTARVNNEHYLFAAGDNENGVSIFRVKEDGSLVNSFNIISEITTHNKLNSIVYLDNVQLGNNNHLFVASINNGIDVFQMDRATNYSSENALNIKRNNSYSSNTAASRSDYYKVYLATGNFSFKTLGSVDTTCELLDNNQVSLTSDNDDGTGTNCKITHNIVTAGYYYLKVDSNSGVGNYSLEVR